MPASLRSISDHDILSRTKALSVQERTVTLCLLLHLNEIERRQLYLKQGFATLFAYCTEGLGYSAAAAMRRIQTARCISRFPRVYDLLEANDVNLSTISRVSGILTQENGEAVLSRIRGKSQREVEAIVAEFTPLAEVPHDRVRTVVVRVPVSTGTRFRNGNDAEQKPASASPTEPAVPGDSGKSEVCASRQPFAGAAVLERRALIQFSASETFMAKLAKVRSLAAHRLPVSASLEQVLELALNLFIEKADPVARHERRKEHLAEATPSKQAETSARKRHIPARVRDRVFARDHTQCTYVGPDGRRCASRHLLQIDHIQPVARGGPGTIDNLRLLCANHNRLEAGRVMGRSRPPD